MALHTADSLITAPMLEPLDLEEVKKHLRFGSTTEDTLIDGWIVGARQYFEAQTGRQILTATWELWLDGFPPDEIELPYPPLQSVTSVKYIDLTGNLQTVTSTDYVVEAPVGPFAGRGRIRRAFGTVWPSPQPRPAAVRIRFLAGYGDQPGDVPDLVRGALYFLVGHFHRHREEATSETLMRLPMGARIIMDAYRSRQTVTPRWV